MATINKDVFDQPADPAPNDEYRLPEMLAFKLRKSILPDHIYRYIVDFMESKPNADQIANFRPSAEMIERLNVLLDREKHDDLTPVEKQELDEYERIEHLIIMIKARNLPPLSRVK